MSTTLNASTSSGLVQSADTSGTLELQSNGTTQLTVASTGAYGTLKSATAVASTSGTSIDFTSIPSWVKRITIMFAGVSTNGTSVVQIQLGTGSTTYTTSGYTGATQTNSSIANSTTGFATSVNRTAAQTQSGLLTITNLSGNVWACAGNFSDTQAANNSYLGFSVSLAAALTAVRITTVNGTDTFDAGTINIIYEG